MSNNLEAAKQKDGNNLALRLKEAGIDPTVDRWSNSIPHHPKSIKLVKALAELDFSYYNDYFGWKTGGDGDNGETLMYQLDVLFELQDFEDNAASCLQKGV